MLYIITKVDVFNKPKINTFSKPFVSLVFILNNQYSDIIFQGIILNNKVSGVFITRKPQVIVFQKLDPIVLIDISIARNYRICFRKEEVMFIGTIQVSIFLGNIMFYMLLNNILFLYCL
jgi:hypothetical protein